MRACLPLIGFSNVEAPHLGRRATLRIDVTELEMAAGRTVASSRSLDSISRESERMRSKRRRKEEKAAMERGDGDTYVYMYVGKVSGKGEYKCRGG